MLSALTRLRAGRGMKTITALLLVLIVTLPLGCLLGPFAYEYRGQPFQGVLITDATPPAGSFTTEDAVHGILVLDSALEPRLGRTDIAGRILSYSFTDGRSTLTQADSEILIEVETDSHGDICFWSVIVPSDDRAVLIRTSSAPGSALDAAILLADPSEPTLGSDSAVSTLVGEWTRQF